jgi:hypothetical protein
MPRETDRARYERRLAQQRANHALTVQTSHLPVLTPAAAARHASGDLSTPQPASTADRTAAQRRRDRRDATEGLDVESFVPELRAVVADRRRRTTRRGR